MHQIALCDDESAIRRQLRTVLTRFHLRRRKGVNDKILEVSMKLLIKFALFIILIPCALAGCSGESKQDAKDVGQLRTISASWGSFHGGYWFFDFTRDEADMIHLKAEGRNGVKLDLDIQVEQSVLDEIAAIITDKELWKLNGKEYKKEGLVDGASSSVDAEFANGSYTYSFYGAGDTLNPLEEYLLSLAEELQ